MLVSAERGSRPRRFHHRVFSAAGLAAAKGATTVSVCLPARNEAATIGQIVATVRTELVDRCRLVDEIIVADDHSVDATATVARGAGATVVPVAAPADEPSGKGAAMRTAVAASIGEAVVFLDADVENFASHFVVGLLGPLLSEPGITFVKATYRRPLAGASGEGGRVTELVAKPLLALLQPELACFSQPLAGEIAARRSVITSCSLPADYGVDVALLLDVARRFGLDQMAEVDLDERVHRNRPLSELAPQARSVTRAILQRTHVGDAPGSAPRVREPSPTLVPGRSSDTARTGWTALRGDGARTRQEEPCQRLRPS
ncbi:MAG: glucosyl-3-phosphoglycerate synthase [Acidimicrobiales bacterium]